MNGKGDSPRSVDRERYEKNYEEIDWSRPSVSKPVKKLDRENSNLMNKKGDCDD